MLILIKTMLTQKAGLELHKCQSLFNLHVRHKLSFLALSPYFVHIFVQGCHSKVIEMACVTFVQTPCQ